jgi:hypothetical protein
VRDFGWRNDVIVCDSSKNQVACQLIGSHLVILLISAPNRWGKGRKRSDLMEVAGDHAGSCPRYPDLRFCWSSTLTCGCYINLSMLMLQVPKNNIFADIYRWSLVAMGEGPGAIRCPLVMFLHEQGISLRKSWPCPLVGCRDMSGHTYHWYGQWWPRFI